MTPSADYGFSISIALVYSMYSRLQFIYQHNVNYSNQGQSPSNICDYPDYALSFIWTHRLYYYLLSGFKSAFLNSFRTWLWVWITQWTSYEKGNCDDHCYRFMCCVFLLTCVNSIMTYRLSLTFIMYVQPSC